MFATSPDKIVDGPFLCEGRERQCQTSYAITTLKLLVSTLFVFTFSTGTRFQCLKTRENVPHRELENLDGWFAVSVPNLKRSPY
jgi:hypothetical protein